MPKSKSVKVVLYEDEGYSFYGNPLRFINFLDDIMDGVPQELKDNVILDIDSDTRQEPYGDAYPIVSLEISYSRPETNDEKHARLSSEKSGKDKKEQAELEQLERLEKKYRNKDAQ